MYYTKGKLMKNIFFLVSAFIICAFSRLSSIGDNLEIKSISRHWNISSSSGSIIRAYNEKSKVELVINISNILPSSPYCLSNKRIKDIKFDVTIYKMAKEGEKNWKKSFEKTRIYFSGRSGSGERKVYASNLIKDSFVARKGMVNVGKLEFLSPITCKNVDNMSIRISGMKDGNKNIDILSLKIKFKKDKN